MTTADPWAEVIRFDSQIEAALADGDLRVVWVDVDRHDRINEHLREATPACLHQLAAAISVRSEAFTSLGFRGGGDPLVLATRMSAAELSSALAELSRELNEQAASTPRLTLSVGIVDSGGQQPDMEPDALPYVTKLKMRAEIAALDARREGGNAVTVV